MTFAVAMLWTLSLAAIFAAAVSDFRHRIIPNRLVVVSAGCGLALRLLSDPRSVGLSLVVAVAIMLVLGLLAHQQVIGGGDAKLIAAVTLLVPPGRVAGLLLLIAIGGGLLSGMYLLAHLILRKPEIEAAAGAPARSAHRRAILRVGVFRAEVAKIAAHRSIPYGLAVFAGAASYALTEVERWFYATS